MRVGSYDWRTLLWRSEDDPPDIKQLDLDEDEDESACQPAGPPVDPRRLRSGRCHSCRGPRLRR
jgi:hypothetical protein